MEYFIGWIILTASASYITWYINGSNGWLPTWLCVHERELGTVEDGRWVFRCLRCKIVRPQESFHDAVERSGGKLPKPRPRAIPEGDLLVVADSLRRTDPEAALETFMKEDR